MVRVLNRAGLSLIELCLAVGILATAILTMVGVYVAVIRLGHESQEQIQALGIARHQMEMIRGVALPTAPASFDGRTNQPRVKGFPPEPYPGLATEQAEYFVLVRVENDIKNVKLVTVEVHWSNGQVRLETLVFEDPTG